MVRSRNGFCFLLAEDLPWLLRWLCPWWSWCGELSSVKTSCSPSWGIISLQGMDMLVTTIMMVSRSAQTSGNHPASTSLSPSLCVPSRCMIDQSLQAC